MTHGVAATGGALSAISSNYIPKGADWAGGLPRGRGASAAPAPLAAAEGGLGVHVASRDPSVERPTTEPLLMFLDLDGD